MKKFEPFNTDRLIATPLQSADLRELCVMHQDPEVMKYMGGVRSEEQTKLWLRDHLDHCDMYGFGCWIFRDRADGSFVGRGLLRHSQLDNADEVELGYALMSRFWRMGLATEMAKAIVAIGFKSLELENLVALVDAPNMSSRRVAEKIGFHFERNTIWKSLPTMLFRLEGGKWIEQQRLLHHS
jgi:ribosomal-protein-alanine N-acetyltransferase